MNTFRQEIKNIEQVESHRNKYGTSVVAGPRNPILLVYNYHLGMNIFLLLVSPILDKTNLTVDDSMQFNIRALSTATVWVGCYS